ncbi:unnamed protein product [Ambrosiozyma monospora]|uniref:Unnamed protein product n=1 Tax=Ambrosiozyma monospora TaxID=43982 RepID=A0ACB5TY67_AMBMO|nr:unnamed protein product [Ambrosiozyma monospora]
MSESNQTPTQTSAVITPQTPSTTHSSSGSTHTRSKYACSRCKRFKRKCDGKPWIKPCSSCVKANMECSMMDNDTPTTDKFTYIRMLEEKMKYLEEEVESLKHKVPAMKQEKVDLSKFTPEQPSFKNTDRDENRMTGIDTTPKPEPEISSQYMIRDKTGIQNDQQVKDLEARIGKQKITQNPLQKLLIGNLLLITRTLEECYLNQVLKKPCLDFQLLINLMRWNGILTENTYLWRKILQEMNWCIK